MDIQKLQKEKTSLAQEVASLQGDLNKIKSNIINKKNDEKIVKVGYLKQNIEDLNSKIEKFKGIHSRNSELKQEEKNKKVQFEALEKKIPKLKEELENLSNLIILKNNEIDKQSAKNSANLAENEKDSMILKNLIKEEIFVKENLNKAKFLELSAEYSKKTSGADPFFLLAKSEEQKEKLQNKLKELQEYYNHELNTQMELIIPQKQQEKAEMLNFISELNKKKKEVHDEFAFITSRMNGLEEEYESKKAEYREKQEIIREIEEELEMRLE